MTQATVDDRWKYCGLDALIIENDHLQILVLPDVGGHIQQIRHKPSGHDILYENPRVQPAVLTFGDPTSGSLGGFDEMIPTGWASGHQGEQYPDHGEVITQRWQVDIHQRGPDTASVKFFCYGVLSPIRVERIITLQSDEPSFTMHHKLTNLGNRDFKFLWGLHPNFNACNDYRIDLPVGLVYIEHYRQRFFDDTPIEEYNWPFLTLRGQEFDMRLRHAHIPLLLHYGRALEGWLSFIDLDRDIGMAITFDHGVFPFIWQWILQGRRGHFLAALQPWTGFPARLEEAAGDGGACSTLRPAETLETVTKWALFRGRREVNGISVDGDIL